MRTISDNSPLFKPLEDAIYLKLISSLTASQMNVSCFSSMLLGWFGCLLLVLTLDNVIPLKITNPLKKFNCTTVCESPTS